MNIKDKANEFKGIMKEKFENEQFREGFAVGIWSALLLAGTALLIVVADNE